MSGDLNIGTLTATLKGIDQLSPVLKQAAQAGQSAAADVSAAMKAIGDSSVSSAATMKQQLAAATQSVKDLEKAVADYQNIPGSKNPLPQMLADARAEAERLKAALAGTQQATADALKAPGDTGAKSAVEDIGKAADASSQQLISLGRGLREAGTLMTAAFTVPIVGAAVEAVKFGSDFETQMTKVVTLAGASTGEVAGLRDQVLALAPAVGVAPAELAKGLFVVESAGKTGADAMNVLTVAAKMTALGMGDTDTTARSLIGSMFAYQNQNLSAAQAGDILAKTVQMGNMRIDELVGGLARVNPVAAAFGIKFEDITASIATFTHLGGSVDKAVTGIIAVLQTIEKASPATVKGLAAIGLTVEQVRKDIADNGLTEALINLIDVAKASPEGVNSLEKVFGNVRAFVDIMSTAGSQADQYRRITAGIADSNGTIDKAMQELNKTWGQQWKEMAAQVDVLWIRLSDVLLPIFKDVVAFMRSEVVPALTALVDGFAAVPHWVQDLAVVVATFLAALGPGTILLGTFVQALGNISKGMALLSVGEAAAGSGAFIGFLMNPVVAGAALLIAGITVAIYELGKSLGELERHSSAGKTLEGLKDGNGKPLLSISDVQAQANAAVAGAAVPLSVWSPDISELAQGTTLSMGPNFKKSGGAPGLVPHAIAPPESKSAAKQRAADLEVLTDATKSYAQVLELVNNETYEGIKAEMARTGSVGAVAREFGVGITIVKDVIAVEKDYDKAVQDTVKAKEEVRLASIALTDAQQAEVLELMKLPLSLHAIAADVGAADIQVKVFQESLKDMHAAMVDNEAITVKAAESIITFKMHYDDAGNILKGVGDVIEHVDFETIKAASSQLSAVDVDKLRAASLKQLYDQALAVSKGMQAVGENLMLAPNVRPSGMVPEALDSQAQKLAVDLNGIATAFNNIGASSTSGLGQALQGFGQLLKVIERSNAEYDKIATKFGTNSPEANAAGLARTSTIAASVISTAGNFIAQTIDTGAGAGTGSLVAHGALQGMSAGATVGSVIPGLGTAVGAGIGAGVGALAGWIQSGEEWRKVVNDISRDFGGIKVSEDFAKTIDQLESDTGLQRVQAITTQLDQLIQMAGGLNATNFDLFFGKLHDAFSYIQQGSMTVAEVTQILDKNFATFAAAGTNAYGQINDQIRELIALDQQFGTDSQAIADWMKTQAGNMATGLSDLLTQPLIASASVVGKAVTDAQAAVDTQTAAIADATKGSSAWQTATDALKTAQDALTDALTTQHTEGVRNKQALDDLGTAALTTFNAAVASGQTFAQALEAISPQLTTITQAYKDLGLSIDDAALKGLTLENTILNGPNGTGKAVSGLNAIITAATNIGPGVETPEAIAAQQRTLASVYTQTQAATQAAGGTTVDALLPFQQSLHELLDYANKNNIALDDKTQQMINQSKELGIWTDDFETDSQKTRDSIADLINSNEHLAAVLGGAPYVPSGIPGSTGTPPTIPPGLIPPGGIETDPTAPSPIYDPVPEAAGGVGFASGPMTFSTQGNEEFAFSGEGQRFARAPQSGGSQAGSKTYNVTVTAKDPAVEEQWIRDWMRREGVDITVEEIKTGRHTRDIQSALNRVTA